MNGGDADQGRLESQAGLDGEDDAVKEAVAMVKSIRGEPKLITRTIKQK